MDMRILSTIFAFALAPGLALAAPSTPGVAEFDYGYFCALEPVDEGVAEGTISGTVAYVEGPPPFISRGSLVPARIGVGFGVHVRVLPEYEGMVTVHVEHPPMGPDGVTRQVWVTDLSADEQEYLGYSFDHSYELVTGPWRMTATANGRVIYDASFEVLDPALMPPVVCTMVPMS